MDTLLIIVIAIILLPIQAYALFLAAKYAGADNGGYKACLAIVVICMIFTEVAGFILGEYALFLGIAAALLQVKYLKVPPDMFLVFIIASTFINALFISGLFLMLGELYS